MLASLKPLPRNARRALKSTWKQGARRRYGDHLSQSGLRLLNAAGTGLLFLYLNEKLFADQMLAVKTDSSLNWIEMLRPDVKNLLEPLIANDNRVAIIRYLINYPPALQPCLVLINVVSDVREVY